MKGRAEVVYCSHEDMYKEGKLLIRPGGASEHSETEFEPGSIVILLEGMWYRTEPGGIPFAILSFEVSAL